MRSDRMDWQLTVGAVDKGEIEQRFRDDLTTLGIELDEAKIKIVLFSAAMYRASSNALSRPTKAQKQIFETRLHPKLEKFFAQAAAMRDALGGEALFDELRLGKNGSVLPVLHDHLSALGLLSKLVSAPDAPATSGKGDWDEGGPTKKGSRAKMLTADAINAYRQAYPPRIRGDNIEISGKSLEFLVAVFRAGGRELPLNEARELVRSLPRDLSKVVLSRVKTAKA